MAISSYSAAKMICDRGSWGVTNLQLQKMLYIAQMFHMGQNKGRRLIEAQFQAWDYGPVEPNLYRRVRMFGSDPIRDVFFGEQMPASNTTQYELLDQACDALLSKSPGELVAITHWDQGAWAKVYTPGMRYTPIPDELILNEYKLRAKQVKQRTAAA